jgi:hypothetical protein
MSIHLQKFIDRVQGFESRGQKDFIMPMTDARGMHADLTRLLLDLQSLKEQNTKNSQQEAITVELTGGSFK